jgi:hypothetical protein
MASAIVGEELLDARAVGKVDGIFGAADDLFKTAEEEDFDAHGLRSAWHKGIVTPTRGGGQWHRLGCAEKTQTEFCAGGPAREDGEFNDFTRKSHFKSF